jgi:hypothetical protein
MAEPDYVVCLDCETPCYVFEWEAGKLSECICPVCGNDDLEQFALPEDFEDLIGA